MGSEDAAFAGLQASRNGESLLSRDMEEGVRLAQQVREAELLRDMARVKETPASPLTLPDAPEDRHRDEAVSQVVYENVQRDHQHTRRCATLNVK